MKKVKIDKGLYERAVKAADEAGYASVDELLAHAVERALAEIEEPDDTNLEQRLQGLGYIE